MKQLLGFFHIKSPPAKLFFKCFYLFSIVLSVHMMHEGDGNFTMFVYLGYGVFSAFGLLVNSLSFIFPERTLSKWCSVFLALVLIVSLDRSTTDSMLAGCGVFLLLLLFMTNVYRHFHLDREIKDFLTINEEREKLMAVLNEDGKEESKDG